MIEIDPGRSRAPGQYPVAQGGETSASIVVPVTHFFLTRVVANGGLSPEELTLFFLYLVFRYSPTYYVGMVFAPRGKKQYFA